MLYKQSQPHGNSANSNIGYQRTKPSVVDRLKEQLKTSTPQQVYQNAPVQDACSQVRNKHQCSNFKYAINKQKRIGHDEIINLHLMHVALDFPNQCVRYDLPGASRYKF